MRVAYLINSLGAGGAEQSLVELVRPLAERGIELTVVTLSPPAAGVLPSTSREMAVHHLDGRGLPGRVASLRSWLSSARPDLLHTSLFDSDVTGRLAGRSRRVPVLTSLVNTMYDPARLADPAVDARKLRIVKAVDSATARHLTTHFHAITHAVKDSCVETMGLDPRRITVVERGRDRARLGHYSDARRRAARAGLGIPADAPVVVTVGRQEWQKAQPELVEAFGLVARDLPDAHLVLAGRPGHASQPLERARLASGAPDRVHVLGHRDDVADLVCAADVFAFPSHYEGLGGAVIEAMALARPLVVSRIPALEEIVDEGGNALVAAPGAIEEMADMLARLLTDPDLRGRLGERSQAIFEERFTLARSVDRMADLYERVLETSS